MNALGLINTEVSHFAPLLTSLITSDYWRFPKFPYEARNWALHLMETSRSRNMRSFERRPDGKERMCFGREIVIRAPNEVTAERAFAILQNASALLEAAAERQIFGCNLQLRKYHSGPSRGEGELGGTQDFLCRSHIPVECLVAVKTASRLQYIYALAKLSLSYRLLSIFPIDLDPTHSRNIEKSDYENLHVAFAYAIIAAYSAVEEMGLDM